PGEAVAQHAAASELLGEEGMNVVHRVELRARRVLPAGPEGAHAPLHLVEHPARLFAQPLRAHVAAADDVVAVVALALGNFGAARDYEGARGARAGHGIRERIEARLGGRIDRRADVAARDRVHLAVEDAPLLEHPHVLAVERAEPFLRELAR